MPKADIHAYLFPFLGQGLEGDLQSPGNVLGVVIDPDGEESADIAASEAAEEPATEE